GYEIPVGSYGDVTLTATWDSVVHNYSISYVLNGGVDVAGNPSLYTLQSLPLAIVDPTRAGYVFLGWTVQYSTGQTVDIIRDFSVPAGTVGDIVLIANWLKEVPVEQFTVTYNGNGHTSGTEPIDSNSPYSSGGQVTVLGPNSLSRTGYTFLGWATSSDANTLECLVDSTFTIADNVVLYAVWEQNVRYSVSYQPGTQGTFYEQITDNLSYGDLTPEAPEVTNVTGWIFAGWSPVPNTTVTGNAVYVAQWDREMLRVWFVDWNGQILKSELVPYGDTASAPSNPYRAGYTFTGWSHSFSNVVFSMTVTAQYRLIGSVTPTPTVKPSPTATPPVTVTPSPTAPVTVTPSPTPPISSDGNWAFVNLLLSASGAILAGLGIFWVLLRKTDTQQQQPHQTMWLVAVFVLGVVGLAVFLFTSDLSQPMIMINNWTALEAVIFIVQIVCLALAFKPKKVAVN
ncbi:MAG: InlB B-repeat-containing protein, partial [Candidatus Bathyarchaeota archaeon]|nr:InlB B-repeat-containing protein [Candidatus Termitimicrobium sp.]